MLECATQLSTGERVVIRPLARGDGETVQAVFDGLSSESRFYRFLQPVPKLSTAMRNLLADTDGRRHRAAVAWVGDEPVGIVRVVAGSHESELAIEIVDEFHGRGLGSLLVASALESERMNREQTPVVLVHAQNRTGIALFQKFGFEFERYGTVLMGRRSPAGAGGKPVSPRWTPVARECWRRAA